MSPETIAGRYRVLQPIGRGGMGTVWLCRDEVLGREVAVKRVGRLPEGWDDVGSGPDRARALREARSAAALNHRNVVSVFDVVEDGGENWLVMEYVPGRTLLEIVREDGPVPPERAAHIGAQVAAGLATAHARGTIHRDVKPGNILVDADDHAKIGDFGIARTDGDDQLTRTGLLTGTPSYFSPELARGGEPGPASDVWALGATLYAAVEGRTPYPATGNALATLQRIAMDPPPRPAHGGPLTEPITRMMDPDPGSRWAMADAAHALARLEERLFPGSGPGATTQTEPVPALAPTPTDTGGASRPRPNATEVPRRRRGLVAATALALLVIAAVGVVLLLRPDPATNNSATGPASGGSASAKPPSRSPSPSKSPSPSSSPTPSRTPSPSPSDSTSPSGSPSRPASSPASSSASTSTGGASARTAFVESYFAGMPQDTANGWSQLAGSMRSVGRAEYERFWGSIDSVDATDVTSAGPSAVDLVLTYHFSDGRVVRERQRLQLERSGDRYLIADDQVLSSQTISG